MRLYEFEGKQLLGKAGIHVPQAFLVSSVAQTASWEHFPCVVKAQTLFGNRKEQGLIQFAKNAFELEQFATQFLETIPYVLVEEQLKFVEEAYLGIRYDTDARAPVWLYTTRGGSGIEARGGLVQCSLETLDLPFPQSLLDAVKQAFFDNDATLVEINPLVCVDDVWTALDAKVELDDTAAFRHPEWQSYPPRTLFSRTPSAMELAAKEINDMDHRGAAGASFFEFDGTIGILASGGGASAVAMDGLLASGLTPANYTEYSGNPTREKVRALSQLVLSKPGLEGLWVVGGNANFTDIYETLSGVMDAIEEAQLPDGFPIVIRRGGPRCQEAFESVKQRSATLHVDVQLFGPDFPMLETTSVLVKAVKRFRSGKNK